MVAIVTGQGLGLERTSANQLGSGGTLGSAFLGRANDGVTVNAATGNLVIQNSDELLIGRGPDAVVNRTYNSLGVYTSTAGVTDTDNWLHNGLRRIVLTGTANAGGSTATLTDWDGSVVTFNYATGVGYKSSEHPYQDDTLTFAGTVWTWTEGKSRVIQKFDNALGGRITSAEDADANIVTYTYDAATTAGKLTRITTANSTAAQTNYTDFLYTGTNLTSVRTSYYDLATATNKTLTRVRYTYDTSNRLASVRVDKTPGDGVDTATNDAYITTYTYSGTTKQVAIIAQSDGTNLAIIYDAAGKVSKLTQTTATGITRRTVLAYDTVNRITTITQIASNDATISLVSKMTYDALNRLIKLEEPPVVAGANPQITDFVYFGTERLSYTSKYDGAANFTAGNSLSRDYFRYDSNGNLLDRYQLVDGGYLVTRYTYGTKNEVLTETTFTTLDLDGHNGVDPTGAMTTNFAYSSTNQLRYMVSAEGRVTDYRYDINGSQVAQITYLGNTYVGDYTKAAINNWVTLTADKAQTQRVDTVYDYRLNVTSITSYSQTDAAGNGLTTQDWSRIDFTYDQFGKLLTKRASGANALGGEPALTTETFVYDGMGRVISATDLYGVTSIISIVDSTRVTTITTANDTTKTSTYNIAGELTRFVQSGTGVAAQTTDYQYDALGRLRVKIDPLLVKTYYVYDRESRLTGEIDGDGSLTEYKYDANDRIVATVQYATAVSAANITTLGAATANTEIATIRPTANATDRWSWSIYDKAGRLVETIDATGSVATLEYNGASRLTLSTRYYYQIAAATINGADGISGYRTTPPTVLTLPATIDANYDRTIRNIYDNDGLLIATVDEEGYLTEIVYDKAGRQVETIRYTVVAGSDLVTAAQPAFWRTATLAQLKVIAATQPSTDIHNYSLYDGRGRVGATIDGEGNVTRYHYNVRGQVDQEVRGNKVTPNPVSPTLASLSGLLLGGQTLETTNFTYNAVGQVLTQVKLLTGGTETTTFTYDNRGRLLSQTTAETVSSETRTQRFRYDVKGRLIGSLDGVGAATLGASPTDAQIATAIQTYGTQYVYNVADQLTQKITPQGISATGNKTLYYYDADGQLRYEINALGEVIEYKYNVLEDRSDVIVFGTRVAQATLTPLTGGAIIAAVTTAITGITNAALDSRTQFSYTNIGQLFQETDPVNNYDTRYYNSFQELLNEYFNHNVNPDFQSHGFYRRGLKYYDYQYLNSANAGSRQHTYGYDAFGNRQIDYSNNTDWLWHQFRYDRANRLNQDFGVDYTARVYAYDARSNLISTTDRTGKTATFAYDLFNRNATTTTAEGVVSTVKKNAYGQTISLTDGGGRTTTYTYDKNGNLKTATDAAGATINSYDNADRLIEVMDARGVKTRYTYDAVGRVLTEVRDSGGIGATTTYQYDAKGQQTRVTDARGVVSDFTYDLKGQKTRVVQDVGGLGIVTDYQYRADGKVTLMMEAVGTTSERRTDFQYDSMGRLTKEWVDPNGLNLATLYYYDVNNNVVSITDARNFVTRLVYDTENRQIFAISPQGEVVETGYDAEGRAVWTRAYVNRIAQTTVDGYTNEVPETTVRSALVALADTSRDRITRTLYDGDGRRAYAIDGEGYVTRFKYDGANNIFKTIVYEFPYTTATNTTSKANLDTTFGNVDSPPTTASVTTFAYDATNRLTSTTDAEGYTESYEYDAVGNRTKLTNKLNGITNFTYDNLNRVRTEYVNALIYNDAGTQTASGYYKNQYEYDALGNVTRQVEGNIALLATYGAAHATTARETKFEYDKLGRLTKKTQDTFQTNITPVETFAYDARGNLVLYTDPSLAKTYTYYDADNRKIVSISQINATQATYQNWSYDGTGNVVSEKIWGTLVTVPSGIASTPPTVPGGEYRETTFEYDRNGALKKRNIASIRTGSWNGASYVSNAGQTLTVESIFDAFGNLVQEIDANNNVTMHWYDRNGRETAKVDANLFLTKWTRDEDGNVTWERRYATALASAPSASGAAPSVADHADDRITTFGYDKNGRRTTETRVSMLVSTFSGNNDIPTSQNALIGYSYNGLGEVTAKTEANGDVTTYNYDNQGRLSWQRDAAIADFAGNSAHRRTSMFYDGLGNLVRSSEQAVDASGNYATGYSSIDDRITRYGYDKGRLAWTTDATNFTRNTKYDANSRVVEESYTRTKADGVTTLQEAMLASYDLGGRVTQTRTAQWVAGSWADKAPVTTLAYNAYGEVSTKSLGGVVQEQFQYDLAGRVVKSTAGDGIWKLFGYDGNGNATLTITSAGANLSGYADIGAVLAANVIGNEDVNASYVVYDKRNMAAQTVDEGRRLTATDALANLTSSRAYNAFGEVTGETDARNNTTNYTYNAMGRVTKVEAPTVSITSESGVVSNIRPTQLYYYDIAGRQIGTRDANLYLTTRTLLAGTGHEGSEALITSELRPDSSVWSNGYDAFGDARKLTDGLSRITTQSFDKAGRVTQITRPATVAGTLIDSFAYDGLGRKVKAWNNLYGSTDAVTTDYDALGRVVSQRAQGGDVTSISYVWNAALSTTGLATFGGWEETTTYANGKTMVSRTDSFGREVEKTDMGGHIFTLSYDVAGRMTQRTASGGTVGSLASGSQGYTYYNTGQLSGITGSYGSASYGYDAGGNRISESATSASGAQITNATTVYDAMGRMISWTEAGSATTPTASTLTSYDANGNIRRTQATHAMLDAYGNATTGLASDIWYRFDALNRVVLDKGVLSGGTIVRGAGTSLAYDANGNRASATVSIGGTAKIFNPEYEPGNPTQPQFLYISYTTERRTDYTMDAMGRLSEVRIAEGGWTNNNDGTITVNAPVTGTLRSSLQYDLLGRLSLQQDYGGIASLSSGTVTYSRSLSYNAKNQILVDDSTTMRLREGSTALYDTWRTITRNDYDDDGNLNTQSGGVGGSGYALGSIIWQHGQTYKNNDTDAIDDTMTRFDYAYWDSAVQSGIAYDKHYGWSNNNGPVFTLGNFNTNFTTSYTLNGFGQTSAAIVNDGVAKSVAYTLDAAGQIVRRDETRTGNTGQAAPHEVFYRFAGKTMGVVGNNGTGDVGYDASITQRSAASPAITATNAGLFRNGTNSYATGSYADFSQSLDPYNSNSQGSAGGGTYTVRSGDTLQAIAAALYGDGNLWYRIAEANGLSAGAALSEGQSLTLPAGVTKSTHNASTFQPYDAAEAMGDTLPTTPKPPKTPKCGAFGQILLIAIAVAVTALTAGTGAPLSAGVLSGALGVSATAGAVIGGAAAAALGSVVSQGVGVATGIQDKFNFKQVALAGISGAIGGGLGEIAKAGKLGAAIQRIGGKLGGAANVVGDVVKGAVGSALSQGVSVATGLQKSFSWTGVAVAGIGAGIAGAASRGLADLGVTGFGNELGSTMADTIAQAATRSAIKGNSFGDNLIASLPSALGNLAGRALAAGVGTAFDGKGGGVASGGSDSLAVVETIGNGVANGLKYSELMGLRSGEGTFANDALADDTITVTANGGYSDLSGYLEYSNPASFQSAVMFLAQVDDANQKQFSENIRLAATVRDSAKSRIGKRGLLSARSVGDSSEVAVAKSLARKFEKELAEKGIATSAIIENEYDYSAFAQQSYQQSLVTYVMKHGSITSEVVSNIASDAVESDHKLKWGNSGGHATALNAAYAKGLRGNELLSGIGSLVYTQLEPNTQLAQMLGQFVSSPGGATAMGYLNDASFGAIEMFDRNGAISIIRDQNPTAFAMGENAGTARDILTGAVAFRAAFKVGGKFTDEILEIGGGDEALRAAVTRASTLTEKKGIVFATRQAEKQGFELLDAPLNYRGNQGIDLPFFNSSTGRYAVWEAKGGFSQKGLSALSTDKFGITQGSARFIETRLDKYIRFGNGANIDTARNLQRALADVNLDSFVSIYGSRKTYQLPLTGAGVRPAIKIP